ncbi:MAG: hypothetical protein AB7I19_14845 [Planctomycetota bacterium]
MNSPLRAWLVLGFLGAIFGWWWWSRSTDQAPPTIESAAVESPESATVDSRGAAMAGLSGPAADLPRRGHELVDTSPVLLRGVVTWADGVAARNASISARIDDRELTRVTPFPNLVTSGDGTFEGLVPRSVHRVFATSGDCVSSLVEVDTRRGEPAEVGIGMGRLPRLRGVLLDGLSRPVNGQVRVISRGETAGRKVERQQYLGADRRGDFRRDYPLDVELEVQAEVDGAISTPAAIVPAGAVAHDLVLRAVDVQPREFLVLDAAGIPITGVMLGVADSRIDAADSGAITWQVSAKTDLAGRVHVARTPIESATVIRTTLGDGDGHYYETTVDTAPNPVELRLPEHALEAARLSIRLVGELPFEPHSMMLVAADAGRHSRVRNRQFEAGERSVELDDLRVGVEYLLRVDVRGEHDHVPVDVGRRSSASLDSLRRAVSATGGRAHRVVAFGRVTPVRGSHTVDLRIEEPHTLSVRVLFPSVSRPRGRLELRLLGPSSIGRGAHVSGSENTRENTWLFSDLVSGEHRVEVHAAGRKLLERAVEVGHPSQSVLVLQLP